MLNSFFKSKIRIKTQRFTNICYFITLIILLGCTDSTEPKRDISVTISNRSNEAIKIYKNIGIVPLYLTTIGSEPYSFVTTSGSAYSAKGDSSDSSYGSNTFNYDFEIWEIH